MENRNRGGFSFLIFLIFTITMESFWRVEKGEIHEKWAKEQKFLVSPTSEILTYLSLWPPQHPKSRNFRHCGGKMPFSLTSSLHCGLFWCSVYLHFMSVWWYWRKSPGCQQGKGETAFGRSLCLLWKTLEFSLLVPWGLLRQSFMSLVIFVRKGNWSLSRKITKPGRLSLLRLLLCFRKHWFPRVIVLMKRKISSGERRRTKREKMCFLSYSFWAFVKA